MMKTKLLIIAVLVISIAMFSTGAFAYFSAARTTTVGTISAGTLDIELAANKSETTVPTVWGGAVTPPWNLANMVPDKEETGCLWVKNTGTVDSIGVRWNFKNLANGTTAKLENRLQIMELYTSDSLWVWPAALLPGGAYYSDGAYDENSDGKISLGEMARWSDLFAPNNYDWVNDNENATFLTLVAPGNTGYICMKLKMMNGTPLEDNPFQGSSLTYDIVVTANNPKIGPTVP